MFDLPLFRLDSAEIVGQNGRGLKIIAHHVWVIELEWAMIQTPKSLLVRLQELRDASAWQQFDDLYRPLIRNWLSTHGCTNDDVDDLVQDVMVVLVQKLPEFRHNGRVGAFRKWLRLVTTNRLASLRKKQGHYGEVTQGGQFGQMLEQWADDDSPLTEVWNREHDEHVLRQLLGHVRHEFSESTWQAFEEHVLLDRSTKAAAAKLNLSENSVLIAKSRILRRLRQASQLLVDLS